MQDKVTTNALVLQELFRGLRGYVEIRYIEPDPSPGQQAEVRQDFYPVNGKKWQHLLEYPEKAVHPAWHTYFGVSTRIRKRGTKRDFMQSGAVWCDLDDTDDYTPLMDFDPPPNIVVNSGGGYHGYWLLSKPTDDLAALERTIEHIAEQVGGDTKVKDVSRVLRWPGSMNRKPKYGEPIPVEVVHFEPEPRHSLDELDPGDTARSNGYKTSRPKVSDIPRVEGFPEWYDPDYPLGITEGDRDNTLTSYIFKRRSLDPDTLLKHALAYNATFDPPLDEASVKYKVERVAEKADLFAQLTAPGFSYTDVGNAQRLLAVHGDDIVYPAEGGQWLYWSGELGRWAQDDKDATHVRSLVMDTVTQFEMSVPPDLPDDLRQHIERHIKHWRSRPGINNTVSLAEPLGQRTILDKGVTTKLSLSHFDQQPHLLGVPGGVIDLRTGDFQEGRREDYMMRSTPVCHNPEAKCPTFEAFVRDALHNDEELIDWFWSRVGYSITGEARDRNYIILVGETATGKTEVLHALTSLLGDATMGGYGAFIQIETLTTSGKSSDRARAQYMMSLSRFVATSEAEPGQKLAAGLIKQLAGNEKMAARRLYGEMYNVMPQFTMWMGTNTVPHARPEDGALWDRARIVPWGQGATPPEKRNTELRRIFESEYEGILARAVRGAVAHYAAGREHIPQRVKEMTQKVREDQDYISQFVDELCEVGDDCEVKGSDLYWRFRVWMEDEMGHQKQFIPTRNTFYERLKLRDRIREYKDGHGTLYFVGVRERKRGVS